ncbi:beta-3 adrenergic receptor-like [Astyanax mexicanus]|uniref:Beta-3 adrenergic receptor-like n=1 Tax=Astyanax mexicanus TaxID=7994 RepID=A0A8T2LYX3_ASTMX|nr:beta-3 adrenergic receptor-like [Astyanax mexicanus]
MPEDVSLGAARCGVCCCSALGRALALLFMVLLAAATLLGNALTIAVLLGTRRYHTPHGYLKVSLAVADLAVGTLVVPLSVHAELALALGGPTPTWTSRATGATLHPCALVGPVFAGCTLVSISTIFLLTVERAVAVLRPLHRDAVVTRRRTGALIALSWLGSFFLAVSPLLFGRDVALEYNPCSRMCTYTPRAAASALLLFPAFDFTLLAAAVLVNLVSLGSLRRQSRRRRRLAGSEHAGARSIPSRADVRAARSIGALTLAFTASFSPVAVLVVGNARGNEWCSFSFFAFWGLGANSCWNVVIYSARERSFRQRALTLLTSAGIRRASHTIDKRPVFNANVCGRTHLITNALSPIADTDVQMHTQLV